MPDYPLPPFVQLEARWNEETSIFQVSLTDYRHICYLDCDRTQLEKPFKEDPSRIIHNLVDVFRKSLEENGVL